MLRRKLRGIAAGLLSSFVSRNNDVDGYWALGKLYRLVETAGIQKVQIDLLARRMEPASSDYAMMLSAYHAKLQQQLIVNGLSLAHLQHALIELDFGLSLQALRSEAVWGHGSGYRCAISLIDDHGHRHRAEKYGRVAPHDPRNEQRSVGRGNCVS